MASNHDSKVPFGIEIPQGNRKIIILRHKLCLKIQDGGIGKPVRPMAQNFLCVRNYYDTCFQANLRSLNSFLVSYLLFICVLIMTLTHRVKHCRS